MSQTKIAPGALVDSFLHTNYLNEAEERTIHFFRDNFWRYNANRYVQKSDATIWKEFSRWLETNHRIPTRSDWSTLREILEYRLMLDEEQAQPAWIGQTKADTQTIAFKNGLLDLSSHKLEPHSPLWFSPICLPYGYDPEALCPKWLHWLDEVFEGDTERIALLQEWMGYCLTPDTSFQKCMLFYGIPRSGKGTIAEILKRLLGPDNTSEVRLELMGERFQLLPTIGKLLNIADEVDQRTKFHEGIFKSYVAAEVIPAERKGKDPQSIAPTARLLMLANEQLPFKDISGATATRLLILSFNVSAAGREILDLKDQLATELPGIFNWALEGRTRLRARGRFTETSVGNADKEEMVRANNHLLNWASENLIEDKEDSVSSADVYKNYKLWCKEHGIDRPLSEPNLARAVRISLKLPPVWKPEQRREFGEKVRHWPGFRLPGEWDE